MKEPLWIGQLTARERSTLIATFAGWMVDGLDVMAFSFVLPALIVLWHLSKGQAGLLGTSALLISSIGGWLAGILADRFGRVRVLSLTILWFALFTFASGFTQNFSQLLIVRGLQGLGFGGEWAVGAVLMGETIHSQWRGKAVGTVQAGWAIGWGISAFFYTVLFGLLPPSVAWRAMFWIGILPALLIFYIRRHVQEPEIFRAIADRQSMDFIRIFAPSMLRTTLLASLVSLGAQGGYYAITTWLPLYLKSSRGLTALSTGGYLGVVIAGSFAGYIAAAYLTDRLGRRPTLILFAACSLIAVVSYTSLSINNNSMLMLGFPLGFFASGSFSPLGAFFTELFPTPLRASGQGFSYNFGRATGALFPTLVGYFSDHISLGHSIALFAAAAYMAMVGGVMLLPETRHQELLS